MSDQSACMGCLLNPGFQFPPMINAVIDRPLHMPRIYKEPPEASLTGSEMSVLSKLKGAWEEFLALGNHTDSDLNEFNLAIHAAQQKLALRVARRANPDVWSQP